MARPSVPGQFNRQDAKGNRSNPARRAWQSWHLWHGHRRVGSALHGRAALWLAALLAALAWAAAPAQRAHAGSFLVTKTADTDDGSCDASDCSLREAILAANAAGPSTISLPAGTYTLTIAGAGENAGKTGDLDVTQNLTITGALSSTTVLDGGGLDRVLDLHGIAATLSDLTVQHGSAADGSGGGILSSGALTVLRSQIRDNSTSVAGGGITNSGTTTLTDSAISSNVAHTGAVAGSGSGGGILNLGVLVLINTSLSDNLAEADGGGIYNGDSVQSTITLIHATVERNQALSSAPDHGLGGGIANFGVATVSDSLIAGNAATAGGGVLTRRSLSISGSTLSANAATFGGAIISSSAITLTNSTIGDNTATQDGGGLANIGALTMNNVTIAGNQADSDGNGTGDGGGLYTTKPITLSNTLLALNLDNGGQAADCQGALVSRGYNLIQTPTGCTIGGDTSLDIVGQAPLLGPLTDNGGPTPTRALLDGSPARDAGSPTPPGSGAPACTLADQRGVTRPQGHRCDIGAFETIISFRVALPLVGNAT
jgi:CSLREA domain-containing protein